MKDTELTRKWIAALRSGNYNQGRYLLHSKENNYCCLGVLCDISLLGEWLYCDNERDISGRCKFKSLTTSLVSDNYPPKEVRELVGLELNEQCELVAMNDNEKCSFDDIANRIEEMIES